MLEMSAHNCLSPNCNHLGAGCPICNPCQQCTAIQYSHYPSFELREIRDLLKEILAEIKGQKEKA